MKIILVRHGESKSNKNKTLAGGVIDSELSEVGKEQIKKISDRLKCEKIEAIYSSDMKRTIDTAEEIAKPHKLKVVSDKRLREFNFGDNIEFNFNELLNLRDNLAKEKNISTREVKMPGGESEINHFNRIQDFLKDVVKKHTNSIVVVAHSGTNKNIFGVIGYAPIEKMYKIKQFNTCVNELEFLDKKWTVNKINCIEHLENEK